MENTTIASNFTGEDDDDYYYDGYVDICAGGDSYWQRTADNAIQLYIFPIVIIGGSLCNLLAVIVLQTKSYRGTSTGFLMTALALADWGLLLTGILRRWVLVLTEQELDLRMVSALGCKFNIFLTYFFQYLSAWTLALITIERATCVCNPFNCKQLCSLKRIVIGWAIIFVLTFAVNMQFFWSYNLEYDPDYEEFDCYGVTKFLVFLYDGAHNWIDFFFPCVLPFGVIIGCNIAITAKLVAGNIRRKNMQATSKSNQTSSTTIMLLTVSIMFLIMVTPFAIYSLGEVYEYWPNNDARDCAKLDFTYNICYLLFNLNSAINFLLYCASGSKFRKAFLSLFCPKKYSASRKSMYTRSTANTNVNTTNTSRNKDDPRETSGSTKTAAPNPSKESSTLVQFADIVNESRTKIIGQANNRHDVDDSKGKLLQNGTKQSNGHVSGIANYAYEDTDVDAQESEDGSAASTEQNADDRNMETMFEGNTRHIVEEDECGELHEKEGDCNDLSKTENHPETGVFVVETSEDVSNSAETSALKTNDRETSQSRLSVPQDDQGSLNIPFGDLSVESKDTAPETHAAEEQVSTISTDVCGKITIRCDTNKANIKENTSSDDDLTGNTAEHNQKSAMEDPEDDSHDETALQQDIRVETEGKENTHEVGALTDISHLAFSQEENDEHEYGCNKSPEEFPVTEDNSEGVSTAHDTCADEESADEVASEVDIPRSQESPNAGPNPEKKNYRVTFGLIVKEVANARREKLMENESDVHPSTVSQEENGTEDSEKNTILIPGKEDVDPAAQGDERESARVIPVMEERGNNKDLKVEKQHVDTVLNVSEKDTDLGKGHGQPASSMDAMTNGVTDTADTVRQSAEEPRKMNGQIVHEQNGLKGISGPEILAETKSPPYKQKESYDSDVDQEVLPNGYV